MNHILSPKFEQRKSISFIFEPNSMGEKKRDSSIFSSIDVASIYQPWINFCYYVLLIPFKIERNDETYYYTTNCVQKMLCAMIHPIVGINAIFEIRGAIVGKVRDDPAIFIHVVDRTNTALFCYIYFYTVWFKKDAMLAIFKNSDPMQHSKNICCKVIVYCCAVLLFSTFAFTSSRLLSYDFGNWEFGSGFEAFSKQLEFEFGVNGRNPKQLLIMSVATLLVRFYKWVLIDVLISLTGLTSFVCFKLAKKFKELMLESSGSESAEIELKVFNSYAELKELFENFNGFIGPICVVVFGSIIAFCAVSTVDILDSEGWSFPFTMSIYIMLSSSMMIFSAEAHYQASYFKTWLLMRRSRSLTTVIDYLEADNSNLAIKGGRLFTITYGFLGTVSSVVLTSAIIMIQFTGRSATEKPVIVKY